MARNQQKADMAANSYKQIKKRIEQLKAKREELQEKNKTEKVYTYFQSAWKSVQKSRKKNKT